MEDDRSPWQRPWTLDDPVAPARVSTSPRFVNADDETERPMPDAASGAATEPQALRSAFASDGGADLEGRLAPPADWSEHHDGPGSPRGSVRPPDTTATVDAPPARRASFLPALAGALVGAVLGTAGTLVAIEASPAFDRGDQPVSAPMIESNGSGMGTVAAVAAAITPSVVRIDILQDLGGADEGPQQVGLGSGVIYRSDGYIITNNHVVEDADELQVRLSDGESVVAEVIGTDPLNDLAVLKVDRTGLPAINLRTDPPLQVGEAAIAIGSPFGLDASVTAGVISGVNRDLAVPPGAGEVGALLIPAVVQTDAAINPGNSGGALVDANGLLIGINTAIFTETGGNQGVGFAIPTASAVATADQLIEEGFVRHAFLGISGANVPAAMAERLGFEAPRGALVEAVEPDSGAADAGLASGDVIVEVEGELIEDMTHLVVLMRQFSPGDQITLSVIRDGEELDVEVELGERPR